MSSEQVATGEVAQTPGTVPATGIPVAQRAARGRSLPVRWLAIIGTVVALNVIAFAFFPPFPKGGQPGDVCVYPACFINGTLEFPAPPVIHDFDPATAPSPSALVTFHPSISSTILTMWIVMAVVIVGAILMTRGRKDVPGRLQNLAEFAYESLQNFATSLGGPAALPYVPLFAAFFIFILFSNWSGLVPPIGKIHELRAPTSDVNITIGLALVSFVTFHVQGFRKLGFSGYLGKFFPLYEFRQGIGAGVIALFVGLVELMLEFVKPLTLSMRLFGNIYGGEVALGVITALTISFIPVLLFGLEVMLNAVQALIFSVLTLMFTLGAIESHHPDEGELGHEAADALEGHGAYQEQPAPAH